MENGNKKKSEQLEMSHGAASGKLRKAIMFDLIKKAGKNICFQCGETIDNIANLSIEHKIPWLDSEDPVGLFFDLDNITFSHLSCNCASARRKKGPRIPRHGTRPMYTHGCRCPKCVEANTERTRKRRAKLKASTGKDR